MHATPRLKMKLTPVGRFISICAFLFLLVVYFGVLYLVMVGVVRGCRAFDLPQLIGERWLFIPALLPFPVGLLVSFVARRCGYHDAVRRFIESKGYGVVV